MPVEYKVITFVLATSGIVWVSRTSLKNVQYHGFYRFFAWETILILFLMNMMHSEHGYEPCILLCDSG